MLLLIVALAPFLYYLLAIYCSWDFFRKSRTDAPPNPFYAPPASILKPVRGVDREAYENFASFCRLDYPEYEIVFAIGDPHDPAIPVIEKLRHNFPERAIRLVTSVPQLGANCKLNNLCKLVQEAKYDLLVMNDSDVRVERDYLRQVAAPFVDPEVGVVTTFFRGVTEGSLVAELEALVLGTETVPNAPVARKIEGKVRFAFGWTMATTKWHLAETGGFEAMVNRHSDDFELGNRIAAEGFKVELIRMPVQMVYSRKTMGEFLRHELRWAIGLKNVRRMGYLGLLLTFGLPWAMVAAMVTQSVGVAAAYLAAYLMLRLGLVWMTGVWGLDDPVSRRSWWLVPLRDAVTFLVWMVGLFGSTIEWRGTEYRVRKGLLVSQEKGARAPRRAGVTTL
jgi:ceramide glucosyltransferase